MDASPLTCSSEVVTLHFSVFICRTNKVFFFRLSLVRYLFVQLFRCEVLSCVSMALVPITTLFLLLVAHWKFNLAELVRQFTSLNAAWMWCAVCVSLWTKSNIYQRNKCASLCRNWDCANIPLTTLIKVLGHRAFMTSHYKSMTINMVLVTPLQI